MKIVKGVLGLVLAIGLLAFNAGEGDKVPQKVIDAFAKKFPATQKVKWEKESEKEWEAEFKMNKVEYSANFLEDGTWLETEHEISEKEVPQNVKSALLTAFPGYEIEEVEISETQMGMVYEFDIEKGETEMEVAIDKSGKIVKQEVKKEDDNEDKD
jgi:uncharacterized membrane protein YkoI